MDSSYLLSFFEGIRDEKRPRANTATRIGEAFILLLGYIASIDYPYLRKDVDDTAEGRITFLRGIAAHLESLFEGLTFSDILKSEGASAGKDGTGIYMDAKTGTITTDGLEVRGWMRVAKLVYNMLQVMEQDYQFSGGGDIERVQQNQDGTLTLFIHKEREDRHTSFADGDILYGKVDEQTGVSGYRYQTSWMRVCQDGVTLHDGMQPDEVRVELWDDDAVTGGRNFPPKAMMTVARRGNTTNTARQSYWELSTTEERIAYYWHVDQPILRPDNYALCLGMLPTLLDDAGILPSTRDRSMPSLYVNSVFYENAHRIRYPSAIVKTDRGEWTATPTARDFDGNIISEPYHHETYTRATWLYYRNSPSWARLSDEELRQKMMLEFKVDLEVSRVWHHGCLWEAVVDAPTDEPWFTSQEWRCISGDSLWALNFFYPASEGEAEEDELPLTLVSVRAGHVDFSAKPKLLLGNEDVTEENVTAWKWTRESFDTAADATWNTQGKASQRTLHITNGDVPSGWKRGLKLSFICTATLAFDIDGSGTIVNRVKF